jgi:hypothetical protein
VNNLQVENLSGEYELFVQSGDLIRGGRQDRMIATDMLVPPRSGPVEFPAHCVEQGRWTGRGNEAAAYFATSNNCAVGKDLKLANASGDQSAVWAQVRGNQQKLNDNLKANVNCPESPTSLQLTLENRTVQEKVADFEKALLAAGEGRSGIVGVVFVVNGKVSGAEVYGSAGLFKKAWPKLLRSAAVEAMAEKPKDRPAPCPSAREVEVFLASASKAEPAAPAVAASPDPEPFSVSGRSVATGNRLLREGGGNDGGRGRGQQAAEVNQTEGRAVQTEGRAGQIRVNRPTAGGRVVQNPAPAQQPAQRGFVVNDLAADNVGRGNAMPQPASQPPGNRLNVNRVDNRAAVVIEARDAAQPSAVIHKSFIAK